MKKKKLGVFISGMALSIAVVTTLCVHWKVVKIREVELAATCNALREEKDLEGMEKIIRAKYPNASPKTVAGSTEIAPNHWRPDSWRIFIGPESVHEKKFWQFRLIFSEWNQVEISKFPREKNIERGYDFDMYFGKLGFSRVDSRKASVGGECAIERTAFVNWYY